MKIKLMVVISLFTLLTLASTAQAAPLTLTLVQTSGLFNEDPPGAPLPLGRTQYDSGDVLSDTGAKAGEYLRVKDVNAGGKNMAAVTITLFFSGDPAFPVTLQGSHSFNNGNEIGSISATGSGSFIGVPYQLDGATDRLTILFP